MSLETKYQCPHSNLSTSRSRCSGILGRLRVVEFRECKVPILSSVSRILEWARLLGSAGALWWETTDLARLRAGLQEVWDAERETLVEEGFSEVL